MQRPWHGPCKRHADTLQPYCRNHCRTPLRTCSLSAVRTVYHSKLENPPRRGLPFIRGTWTFTPESANFYRSTYTIFTRAPGTSAAMARARTRFAFKEVSDWSHFLGILIAFWQPLFCQWWTDCGSAFIAGRSSNWVGWSFCRTGDLGWTG